MSPMSPASSNPRALADDRPASQPGARLLPFGPVNAETRAAIPFPEPPEPDEAWEAVLARDPRYDGRLVYAVASTGIYCRPTCPSRRPARRQVTFHPGPTEAEAAGYRACRRCFPKSATPAEQAVAQVLAYLDAHLDEPLTLERLGEEVGMSPAHLQRTFKRQVGLSPREYVAARRVERFKERLRDGDDVTTALYEAGYGASSRLYEQAGERLGMTPGAYRKGGAGLAIRYTLVDSPLGRLLVAGTERGLCAVTLGDDDEALEAALQREYPKAVITRDAAALGDWVQAVAAHLEAPGERLDLPLDLQATAFQLQVWKALRQIPPGATRSYGEVAAALGRPSAARAVARACASNPVAVVIPCHRVVPATGETGGYRWGTERKKRLLAREGAR